MKLTREILEDAFVFVSNDGEYLRGDLYNSLRFKNINDKPSNSQALYDALGNSKGYLHSKVSIYRPIQEEEIQLLLREVRTIDDSLVLKDNPVVRDAGANAELVNSAPYQVFLMSQLMLDYELADKDTPYDEWWTRAIELYKEFCDSSFNVDTSPEYECIEGFLCHVTTKIALNSLEVGTRFRLERDREKGVDYIRIGGESLLAVSVDGKSFLRKEFESESVVIVD